MAAEDRLISKGEKQFLLGSLRDGLRADGRFMLEYRRMTFAFDRSDGKSSAEVTIGNTRVLAVVTATVAVPFPDRPNEGFLSFTVNTSPMTGPSYDASRQTALTAEMSRMLERQIRESRALDTEALCIAPGHQVWALRCDVHILDDCGNIIDAAALATIGAILHFRRADVSVVDGTVKIHSYSERAPVPLAMHHIPICVSFGLFSNLGDTSRECDRDIPADIGSRQDDDIRIDREIVVLDPTDREELVADGTLTFVMNAHKELCGVHKLGGCAISARMISACAVVAGTRASANVKVLQSALAAAEAAHLERQRARHAAATLGLRDQGTVAVSTQGEVQGELPSKATNVVETADAAALPVTELDFVQPSAEES